MELIKKNGKYYLEVVILPQETEKCEDAFYLQNGKLKYHKGYLTQEYLKDSLNAKSFHIYLLSKEIPKKGDWIIRENHQRPVLMGDDLTLKGDNKIIATSNNDLRIDVNEGDELEPISLRLPNIPIDFIQSFTDSYNKGNVITKVLVETSPKIYRHTSINCGEMYCELKLKDNSVITNIIEEKVYTEEEIIFGVRKMLSAENIKFHYVREELPKFLEEAKNEIISFKTNLKK
jgi:hypothetical protein